jgi:tripartite-type tricarboxylate transporter receptor subunit TctC
MSRQWLKVGLVLGMATSTVPAAAGAEAYPSHPVKIIVQAAAGNGPDLLARIIAERLTGLWGQQVLVINRPGGGGIMAGQAAAAAAPDGYTLYMPSASTVLVLPSTQARLPFDLERDFIPIGLVSQSPFVIAVAPGLGVNSLPELIALAKRQPGELFYAALGRGTLPHLTGELLQRRAGITLTYVPYSGTVQALQDVMGGRLSIIVDGLGALSGAIEAGAVKLLAITSSQRLAHLPDIPTVAETLTDFSAFGWFPMLAPAGTPASIVHKVNADLRIVLDQPNVRERLASIGSTVRPMSPAELVTFMRDEQRKWKPVLNEVGPSLR